MPISDGSFRGSVKVYRTQLKQSHSGSRYHRPFHHRIHVLSKSDNATNVAVLGGGITGLASAYFLSQKLPKAKIVLFESSHRLGGWVYSRKIDMGKKGKIVFEQGPRSLRPETPSARVTLELVSKLGLASRLLTTSKKSAAAQNRFLYYPDHLVRMPTSVFSNLYTLVSEPLFDGLFPSLFMEPLQPPRPDHVLDESVASFLSRRLGSPLVADNIVSAVFHGIYAGDIHQLSARSLLSRAWQFEGRYGSFFKAAWAQMGGGGVVPMLEEDVTLLKETSSIAMENQSVFTLVGGIGELAQAMVIELANNPNVEIRTETHVEQLQLEQNTPDPKVEITSSPNLSPYNSFSNETFSHVISTIPGVSLDKIADLPPLSLTPSVTVMVVNLFFSNPDLLPVRGFGYLIPRTIPFLENPEMALGVVFDSETGAGQDTIPGTKVTVMLGGHWWDGWDAYPDEEEGANMAKALLKRHLKIDEKPILVRVGLQKNCIPQYTVGHEDRMAETSRLLERFQGKLRVAGSSYTGVGLNDCVRAARDVVDGLVDGTGKNGLESFVGGKKWVWVKSGLS